MQQHTKWTTLAGLIALSLQVSSAQAEEAFRDHDAHMHGHVEFNIAQDGQELLLEVSAPGADIVGFEHPPQTDSEKQALAKAIDRLRQPQQLITLSGNAHCELEFKSVKHTLSDEQHDHADHDSHKHEEKHEHDEHKNDHHEDNHHDHEPHAQHGSFTVEYHYQCGDVSQLSAFQTTWFDAFPSTKSIEVNVLTDRKQTALELTPTKTHFKF